MKKIKFIKLHCILFFILSFLHLNAQEISQGPYDQLIIRGVTLINGNGAPPIGPIDIEVKNNIITKIQTVGYPGIKKRRNGPVLQKNGKELNCDGMYILPGFLICTDILEVFLKVQNQIMYLNYGWHTE